MKIEIIDHESGDQLPILLDASGMPLPLPMEFILGRRALSTNTHTRNLRELSVLFRWADHKKIDFVQRIRNDKKLTEAEVVGGLVEALRKEQGHEKKIVKMTIRPETFNQRLTTIRQFLLWCFDLELVSIPIADRRYDHVRDHKNLVDSWLRKSFIRSPPTNKGISKGLSDSEAAFLTNYLDPRNANLNGKSLAIRHRNFLVVAIMLYHGLRPGELLCLKVKDIEFGAITCLRVTRRPPNPRDARRPRPQIKRNGRVLPIEDPVFARHLDEYVMSTRDVLQEQADHESDYLILSDEGYPLSQSSITAFFQRLRKRFPGNLPTHLCAKALRHTFSSKMERVLRESGMDEDKRQEALAYLRGDSNVDSQVDYLGNEIEEQAHAALLKYQRKLSTEASTW
jgi:integrase